MKIHFDNVSFSGLGAKTGPNTFGQRLAHALCKRGHEIVDVDHEYDIMLSFIQPTKQNRPGSKLVQRLDGIWFKPEGFVENNRHIKMCYENSDLVVWQSDFDMQMTKHWWGSPNNGVVIRNGIDVEPVERITLQGLSDLRQRYDKLFVCSANWHPQKRLKANILAFKHIKETWHHNSALIVLGSQPDVIVPNPHVYYVGSLDKDVYMQFYAAADWMIHLSWLDHSPNTVVECLSQNTPVICSEAGGTKELVKDFGIVLKEQNKYSFELADYDNPPYIDVTQIKDVPTIDPSASHTCIDMSYVCEQYENAFRNLL